MRLLIITQKVNKKDPVLGFFHRWLEEFAKRNESITVICLEEGEHSLPENVRVLSLGKEGGSSKIKYLTRFYRYIWQERNNYDKVFVHMNQEYVLLAGDFWRLMGKKVYLWRNHAKGNILTRLAVWLSHKVFYTSPSSFTARFKKSVQMPVGIDTDFFKPDPNTQRIPNSVLFLGRISPVKRVLEFIDWVKDKNYAATMAGPILLEDKAYGETVKQKLTDKIKLVGPVTQEEARKLYQTHEIYANFTPAGSMDKTVIEAAACGMRLEVKNPDLKNFKVEDHSLKLLMDKLSQQF
ncbi:MAG: glycosyltransferase [bacterium]|nr:glycosyltransferase [bacterium]